MRERWLASLAPGREVWILSQKGDIREYLTKDSLNGDPFGRGSCFHVWKGDKWLYCGPSREKADSVFADTVKAS